MTMPDQVTRVLRGSRYVLALYWLILFLGTHFPRPDLLPRPDLADKWLHFLGYMGLGFLFCLARRASGRVGATALVMVVAVLAGYGAVDELSQNLVRGRSAEFFDWMADVAGAIVGCTLFVGIVAMWRRLRRAPMVRAPSLGPVAEMSDVVT